MLAKIFTSTGPFSDTKITISGSWKVRYHWSLEDEINRWLRRNPRIAIWDVQQSVTSSWFGRQKCIVTIWYDPPSIALNREAAEQLVIDYVSTPQDTGDDEIVITGSSDYSFGWVFHYNFKKFVETGDDNHCMLGNYPIIVDRHTGELHTTGLGNLNDYVERYERTGQTHET